MIGGRKKTRGREDRTSAFKETEGCPQEVKQGQRVCMALITSLGEAGKMPRHPKAACLFLRHICYKGFLFSFFFFSLAITASTSFLYQRSRHIMLIFTPLQRALFIKTECLSKMKFYVCMCIHRHNIFSQIHE